MRKNLLLGCLLMFCGTCMYGQTVLDLSDSSAREGTGYTVVEGEDGIPTLTITAPGEYTVKQSDAAEMVNFPIVVGDEVENTKLTFDNINVTGMRPFVSNGENTVIDLTLVGNSLISSGIDALLITGTMTIGGEGTLTLFGQGITMNSDKTNVTVTGGKIIMTNEMNSVGGYDDKCKFTVTGGEVIIYSKYVSVLGTVTPSVTMLEWKYAAASATEETVIDMKKGDEIVTTFKIPAGYKYFATTVDPTQVYTLWKGDVQMKDGVDVNEFSAVEGEYVKYASLNTANPQEVMELTAETVLEYPAGMFNGITKSIVLKGSWNSAAVTALKDAIHVDKESKKVNETLQEVDMSDITVPASTNFGSLFENCMVLEKVTFPETDVTTETGMSKIFTGCAKLAEIDNLDKMGCTYNWANAFEGCELLESVTFAPENKTTRSTLLNNIFTGCKDLASVENFDSFTLIGGLNSAFEGCESLKKIVFAEETATGSAVSVTNAFKDCKNLETIMNFQRFVKINSYTSTFQNCNQLTYIMLSAIPADADNTKYTDTFKDCNPNCLKYVPTDSVSTVKEWLNVIIDNVMPQSTFMPSEKHAFAVPEDFKAQGVLFNQKCLIDGSWQTICLPFDVLMILNGSDPISNYELKVFKEYQAGEENGKAYFEDYRGDEVVLMKANVPYLISFIPTDESAGATATITFLNYGLTQFVKDANPVTESTECNYKGTYTFMAEEDNIYTFDVEVQKFIKSDGETVVMPFHAYCETLPAITVPEILLTFVPVGVQDVLSDKELFEISMSVDGGILISIAQNRTISIYTADGKLAKTVKLNKGENVINGLGKGIYLIENHKFIVR